MKYIIFLVALFCICSLSQAQISLAPSFLFIDENNGVGTLYISNNGSNPYEVTISFLFGYPGGDEDGNLVMIYDDKNAYSQFALDDMIRAFPRSFNLKGGESRTVRIQLIPGQKQKQGYFYTRLKVLAKPQAVEVSQVTTQGIGAKINFNFEQVTAVFYHKGPVSTGLAVKELDVKQNGKALELRPKLEHKGNAPFLGSMIAKLKYANGEVVAENKSTVTAYFDVTRRMDLNLDKVAPGNYILELSFETQRNDMANTDLIQAPTLVHETKVEIK
jgi:P pilus assembly chaperone PapD